MITYILGTDLWLKPRLAQSMFRDRAIQFSDRLRWPVQVDVQGFERDQYDAENPIYVVVLNENGTHAGSLRFLPTTGRTMLNEHFISALDGKTIVDKHVWECTRFCLSPSANPETASALLAAAGYLMQELDIRAIVAVFDRIMQRRYRASGASPEVLGQTEQGGATVMAGIWRFSGSQLSSLMQRGSIDPLECQIAFVNSSLLEDEKTLSLDIA